MAVSLRSLLAAGAALPVAAAVAPALAVDSRVHIVTVPLPGGGVEQIQYTGDVAPRVVMVPSAAAGLGPMMALDPFATLERISALMDQQAAAMLRQVEELPGMASQTPGLPPGASGYSFVSTMSGNGVCTRSVRITYNGGNAAPKVVSSSSGNCGADRESGPPAEVNTPAPTQRRAPGTIEARATGQTSAGAPLRQVALNR
ncbi:MAG TPA: hypothetical protein VGM32_03580 [Rhodopila sp.]